MNKDARSAGLAPHTLSAVGLHLEVGGGGEEREERRAGGHCDGGGSGGGWKASVKGVVLVRATKCGNVHANASKDLESLFPLK